jgi:tRNA 2-thiouridine synthesizing protein A
MSVQPADRDKTDAAPARLELDLSGLKCPLPALRTRKALKGARPGDRLAVTCTDPMAAIDIPHLIAETGDVLEGQRADGAKLIFDIVKR